MHSVRSEYIFMNTVTLYILALFFLGGVIITLITYLLSKMLLQKLITFSSSHAFTREQNKQIQGTLLIQVMVLYISQLVVPTIIIKIIQLVDILSPVIPRLESIIYDSQRSGVIFPIFLLFSLPFERFNFAYLFTYLSICCVCIALVWATGNVLYKKLTVSNELMRSVRTMSIISIIIALPLTAACGAILLRLLAILFFS